jgi:hypothetical protein
MFASYGVMNDLINCPNELHWGFPMLKHSPLETGLGNDSVPLSLSSILLVETDSKLRDSRRLLLRSLQHPVLRVNAYLRALSMCVITLGMGADITTKLSISRCK